jgi:hypothetical protein
MPLATLRSMSTRKETLINLPASSTADRDPTGTNATPPDHHRLDPICDLFPAQAPFGHRAQRIDPVVTGECQADLPTSSSCRAEPAALRFTQYGQIRRRRADQRTPASSTACFTVAESRQSLVRRLFAPAPFTRRTAASDGAPRQVAACPVITRRIRP